MNNQTGPPDVLPEWCAVPHMAGTLARMHKFYSVIVIVIAVLFAGQVGITGASGEAYGPSPEQGSSDRRGTWHGLWTDCQGGTMRLADRGDTIPFDLEVVRGPTGHAGHISGQAERHRTQVSEQRDLTWLS